MNEPKNNKALETGSGITWQNWLQFLQPHAALNHTDMARLVHAEMCESAKAKAPSGGRRASPSPTNSTLAGGHPAKPATAIFRLRSHGRCRAIWTLRCAHGHKSANP
jgi:hypothetical protein